MLTCTCHGDNNIARLVGVSNALQDEWSFVVAFYDKLPSSLMW